MIKQIIACLAACLSTSTVLAESPTPHTWHTVATAAGQWVGKLQMLNQGGHFITHDGGKVNKFEISPEQALDYGFIYDRGDDFDVAYTLTLVEKSERPAFQSKACVYVITAAGPANPDVRVSSFNGARCDYKVVKGRGENFIVG